MPKKGTKPQLPKLYIPNRPEPKPLNMKFELGPSRNLHVLPDKISIDDTSTGRYLQLNFDRYAKILEAVPEIDEEVRKISDYEEGVNYLLPIGDDHYVSVKSGYRCVDIRRWYRAADDSARPTRIGMPLRLSEWIKFKDCTTTIREHRPNIAAWENKVCVETIRSPGNLLISNSYLIFLYFSRFRFRILILLESLRSRHVHTPKSPYLFLCPSRRENGRCGARSNGYEKGDVARSDRCGTTQRLESRTANKTLKDC